MLDGGTIIEGQDVPWICRLELTIWQAPCKHTQGGETASGAETTSTTDSTKEEKEAVSGRRRRRRARPLQPPTDTKSVSSTFTCSCSIIDVDVVATARHCLEFDDKCSINNQTTLLTSEEDMEYLRVFLPGDSRGDGRSVKSVYRFSSSSSSSKVADLFFAPMLMMSI
jgi:hypothetical protein